MRTWTPEAVKEVAGSYLDRAREIAVQAEVQPVAFVFMTGPDGQNGIIHLGARDFGPQDKDRFSHVLHGLVRMTGADAIMFICEAWYFEGDPDDAESTAEAARLSMEGRLEEHPGRIEVVHATLETVEGECTMHRAVISGELPERGVGEFEVVDSSGKMGGRFANFFSSGEDEERELFRELMSTLEGEFPSPEDD